MSWFSANQTLIDCPSNSIQLTHLLIRASASDSPDLEIVIHALAFLPLLVEYRYSHQILCGPPDLLVDYFSTVPTYSKPLLVLPLIQTAFGNGVSSTLTLVLYFRTVIPCFYCLLYRFVKCPDGLNICFCYL